MKKFLTLLILFIFIQSCDDKKTQQFGGVNLTISKKVISEEIEDDIDIEINFTQDDIELFPLKEKESKVKLNKNLIFNNFKIKKIDDIKPNDLLINSSENQIADVDAIRVTLNNEQPVTIPIINGSASYSRDGLSIGTIPIKVDLFGGGTNKYSQTKSVAIIANQNSSASFNSFSVVNQQIAITNSSFSNTVVQGEQISFDWTNSHAERSVQISVIQDNDNNVIQVLEANYIGSSYALNTNNSNTANNIGFKVSSNIASNTSSSICCFDLVANTPQANDISSSVNEDSSVTIQLDASSPGGESVTYSIVSSPSNGSLGSVSGSNVTYTPNQDFNGSDSFTYKASNGSQDSNTATVSITVNNVNDAPVVENLTTTTAYQQSVSIELNGSDIDGDNLTYFINANPSNGTIAFTGNSTIAYNPNSGFSGSDSFNYGANDGSLNSNIATVSITVEEDNSIVVTYPNGGQEFVIGQTYTLLWNNSFSNTGVELRKDGNKVLDINGDVGSATSLSWTVPSGLTTGGGYVIRVYDSGAGTEFDESDNGFSIISSSNNPPTTNDISVSIDENRIMDRKIGITLDGNDVDGDALTYSLVTTPINGTQSINGNILTYNANQDWNGVETFTYKANDGESDSNISTITITVNPVNDNPVVIVGDPFAENNKSGLFNGVSKVNLGTMGDLSGQDAITVQAWVSPNTSSQEEGATVISKGTNSNSSHRQYGISLNKGKNNTWNGQLGWSFYVSSGGGEQYAFSSSIAKISEWTHLVGVYDGQKIKLYVNGVLDNVVDHSGDINNSQNEDQDFAIGHTTGGGQYYFKGYIDEVAMWDISLSDSQVSELYNFGLGMNALNLASSDLYAYWNLENDFLDQSGNNRHGTNEGVTFDDNVPSGLFPDNFTTDEDTPLNIDISSYVSDVDNDNLTISFSSNASNGDLTANNLIITYTPNLNFNGNDSFSWSVSDGTVNTGAVNTNIVVSSVNDAPIITNQSATAAINQALDITLTATDIENDSVTYSIVSDVSNGSTSLNGAIVTYTPNSNFSGSDSFIFKANDGTDDSNLATVSIVTSKVNITYPVGGESLTIGEQYQLTWDGGFTNTGIELWNGGQKIVDINGDVGTANTFDWTIPSNISAGDGFFIRIYDAGTGTDFVDSNNFAIVEAGDFAFTFPNGGDEEFVIGSLEILRWTNTNGSVKLSLQVDENYDLSGANAGWSNASWSTLWSQDGVGSGFNYTPPSPDVYFSTGNNEHHDLMNTTQENHGRYRFTIENGSGFGSTDDFVFKRSESGTYASNNSLYFDDVSSHGYADFREIMHSFGKPDFKSTVSFWVKNTGDWRGSADSGVFLHNQLSDGSNSPRALRIGVSNSSPYKPYIYLNGPNVNINSTGSTALQKDVWYHFVATIDNTNGKFILYLNGNEEINFDFPPTDFTTQSERLWQLNGFSWDPNHHTLQAYYDDFAVWKTVLSESDISQLYNSGKSMDASTIQNSDLVAYYPFESLDSFSGSHQKTYDISPFRKHGYVYGGVLSSDDPNSNRAPTTNDISVSIDENRIMDRKIGITLEGNDADEDALTYSLVTTPINGTQSINGNILTYNANQDWNGEETFTYKANDGELDSNISTITITVNPVNDNPVVTTNPCCVSLSGEHDYVNLGSNIDFSNNFSIFTKMRINSLDPDNGDGSIISAGVGSQNQGFYFYIEDNNGTPRLGLSFYGQESILDDTIDLSNYIGDGLFHTYATTFNATTKEAKLFIDGQSLVSGNFSTLFGNNNTDVYIGLTPWNSADDMNAFVDYTAIWDGAMGEQEVNELHNGQKNPLDISNGLVGYWDFDSVSTSFNDLSGNSNTASYATNGSEGTGTSIDVATNEDVNLTIDLSPYVTDVDNDQLTYNISTQPSNGSLAVNDSLITYSPNLNYFGTDSFKWYVNDGVVNSDTVGVAINILSINDAPVTTNQSATTVTNQALDITLTSTDIESESITYSIVSDVSNGSTSLNGAIVTYTPSSNFSGSDSFTFKANDGTDDSNVSTVTITVNNRSTKSVEINPSTNTDGYSYKVYPLNFDVNGKVVDVKLTVSLGGNRSDHIRYMNLLLVSPNKSRILLMGGDQQNAECSSVGQCISSNSNTLTNTTFSQDASTFIYNGSAPYIGSFKPNESLSTFVNEEINGDWELHVINVSSNLINVSNIKADITYDAVTGGTTYTEENNLIFSPSDQSNQTISGNSTGIVSIPVSLPSGKGIEDLDFELSLNGGRYDHLRYLTVTVDIGNANNAQLVFRGDQISGGGISYSKNQSTMFKARFDQESDNNYDNLLMQAQRIDSSDNNGNLNIFNNQSLNEFRIYIFNSSTNDIVVDRANTKVYIK